MKLLKWLKFHLKDNVKGTLEETIDHLLQLNPPIKGNTDKSEEAKALKSSLKELLRNDKEYCKEFEVLNTWLRISAPTNERKKIVDNKKNQPVFKNVNTVQYFVSYGADSKHSNNLNNMGIEDPANNNDLTCLSKSSNMILFLTSNYLGTIFYVY
jgi:hypothetical protein